MIYKIKDHKIDFIKREIENHIYPANYQSNFILMHGSSLLGIYNRWFIEVTNETNLKKIISEQNDNLPALHFKYWNAENRSNAMTIEKYFQGKGMHGKKYIEMKNSFKIIFVLKAKYRSF